MTPKIYMGIPSMRGMRPKAFNALPFKSIDVIRMDSTYFLDVSRNIMVADFLKTDCDYLFFVDDDIILPPNAMDLFQIQDAMLAPISMVRYCGAPYPSVYDLERDGGEYLKPWTWNRINENKEPNGYLKNVTVTGSSCYAIRRDVFEKTIDDDGEWFKLLWRDNKGRQRRGEDVYFYRRCRDAGYSFSVNTNVICGHLKEMDLKVSYDYLRRTIDAVP